MVHISDAQKLDVEGLIHATLLEGDHAGHLFLRPSVCHAGVIYGAQRQAGRTHEAAKIAVCDIAVGWSHGHLPPYGPIVSMDDAEILALVGQVDRITPTDWGGLFDLGTQYGTRRQLGLTPERARHEAGGWIVQWYGGENPWPLPPAPVLSRLKVEANRRWFANDHGRFDYREVSAFSLLSRLLTGEDAYVRDYLSARRAEGFTVVRVILTLDGDYWGGQNPLGRSFKCAPDMPGYWQALDRLVVLTADAGLYLRAVFIGAVEPFGGVWHPDRRDIWDGDVRRKGEAFAVEVAQRLGVHAHVIGELANEPGQIGMRESFDELIALGRRCKAVAPMMLLGGGAVDGPNDNDTRLCRAPFDYVDAHIERRMDVKGYEWVKRTGEYATIDQEHQPVPMPFISGEPVNFGEWRADGRNGDVERSPSVAFAYGAVSRARQYNTNFHYDGGLWTTPPTVETAACIRAYHAALDTFPMLTGERWRGHWSQSYWRQVWPPDDDPRAVEHHVTQGRGPWRAFGCGPFSVCFPEPDGWDWQSALTAPATRIAGCSDGAFQASIYRRA
jgi:hypothetical protein